MPRSVITVSPLLDFSSVDHTKENEVHLDVVLEAPEKKDQKRIPLHLVLAIDCSGSMGGFDGQTKLDSVKNTVKKLIENVTENDTLGIVSFARQATDVMSPLPMTAANKIRAIKDVMGLVANGYTNLEDAIYHSLEMGISPDKQKINRIIILTDGQPTCGACIPDDLKKIVANINPSVSITTFGYGNDFNAELMASLATLGRGNNFYIQKDEDCRSAFALELGGLLSMYAQDIKVMLTPHNVPSNEFLSDYKISSEPGYKGITDSKIHLTIDDIYAGEKKHIVIKMKLPKVSDAVCARPSSICSIHVDYLDVGDKSRVTLDESAKISYVKPSKAQKDPNIIVKQQICLLEAAKFQKEAKEKADKGDFTSAQDILKRGRDVITLNSGVIPDSVYNGLIKDYDTAMVNCSDNLSYSTMGAKLMGSSIRGLYRARASSLSGMTYTSATPAQEIMLKSFSIDSAQEALLKSPPVDKSDKDPDQKVSDNTK